MVIQALILVAALAAPNDAEVRFGAPQGAQALLAQTAGAPLVIGELHGTNEAPGFAGALICLALADGETVVLALEISADDQDAIDAFLASDGGAQARDTLLAGDFWTSEVQDGRRSEAMLRLIDGARGWRSEGMPVTAEAVDFGAADFDLYDAHGGETVRDRSMIRRLRAAQAQADRVILLVGNVHARRTALEVGERRIETIGTLGEPGEMTLAGTVYGPGEAWNCRRVDGELACRAHPLTGMQIDGPPRVLSAQEAEELSDPNAHDVFVFLGPASVSPPAVQSPDADSQASDAAPQH